jgi:hypothetical protein
MIGFIEAFFRDEKTFTALVSVHVRLCDFSKNRNVADGTVDPGGVFLNVLIVLWRMAVGAGNLIR